MLCSRSKIFHAAGGACWPENEFMMRPYKFQQTYDLKPKQEKIRLNRAKELLRLTEHDQLPNIVFSGEENVQIEQFVNSQNDRINSTEHFYQNLSLRFTTRKQYPAQ